MTENEQMIMYRNRILGEKLKKVSASLMAFGICSRIVPDVIADRINTVNARLQVMCTDGGWTYVNNDPSFHLGDERINDGYLIPDGVHLTRRAVNRLAQNISLNSKDPKAYVCGASHTKWNTTSLNKQHGHVDTPKQTTTDATDNKGSINVNHAFWNLAQRKVANNTTAQTYPNHIRRHTAHTAREINTRIMWSMLLL